MAGIIKGYWVSAKNLLATCQDFLRVACDMQAGGCLNDLSNAMDACDWHNTDRKPGEDVPADLDKCVKATAAFRRCMQCKPDVFREYIVAMDKGIEENERLRREPDAEVEDGPRFRWWTGMRNS